MASFRSRVKFELEVITPCQRDIVRAMPCSDHLIKNIILSKDRRCDKNGRIGHNARASRLKPRAGRRTGEAPIEKGLITRKEFIEKLSEERVTYQRPLNPTP